MFNITPLHQARIDFLWWAVEAARQSDAHEVELRTLLQIVRIHVYYREIERAQEVFQQSEDVYDPGKLHGEAQRLVEQRFSIAKVLLLIYTDQLTSALAFVTALSSEDSEPIYSSDLRYYEALCLCKLDRQNEAEGILKELLDLPESAVHEINLCRTCTTLAEIYLASGNWEAAEWVVERNVQIAERIRDRYQIARVRMSQNRLWVLQNNLSSARMALVEAIDIFERIGLRCELAEAREELCRLDEMSEAAIQ